MIKLGNLNINSVLLGNIEVTRIMLGNTEIYKNITEDNSPIPDDCLYIEALSDGTIFSTYVNNGGGSKPITSKVIKYVVNDGPWTIYNDWEKVTLKKGDKLYLKSDDNLATAGDHNAWRRINLTKDCNCGGNIMSLMNYSDEKLPEYAFYGLFNSANILTAPELPSTKLNYLCYGSMFDRSKLRVAPKVLPATHLMYYCYMLMFSNTNITEIPEFPLSMTFSDSSLYFWGTFSNCKNLISVTIPFDITRQSSLNSMFSGCSNLNNVTYYPTKIGTDYTRGWLSNVSETGIFYKNPELEITQRGPDTVPAGWTIVNIGELPTDYFYIEPLSDTTFDYNNFKILGKNNTQYSLNGTDWTTFELDEAARTIKVADFNANQLVYVLIPIGFYNDGLLYNNIDKYYIYDDNTGDYKEMTFVKQDDLYVYFVGDISFIEYNPNSSFSIATGRSDMEDGYVLPLMNTSIIFAYIIAEDLHVIVFESYYNANLDMWSSSENYDDDEVTITSVGPKNSVSVSANEKLYLRTIETVERTDTNSKLNINVNYNIGGEIETILKGSYNSLFMNDVNIISSEELILPNEMTINEQCSSMFADCSNMVKAPKKLPAMTLTTDCYNNMFARSGITNAPELPATNLAERCYGAMFMNCTNLKNAPELPATNLAKNCYLSLFNYCTNLETAPELLVEVIPEGAYHYMFYNCKKINTIKCLATNLGSNYSFIWLGDVAANGMFYKNPTAIISTRSSSTVPTGWTIVNYGSDGPDIGTDFD